MIRFDFASVGNFISFWIVVFFPLKISNQAVHGKIPFINSVIT